jgi:hypothetical protein
MKLNIPQVYLIDISNKKFGCQCPLIHWDKNMTQWLQFSLQTIISWCTMILHGKKRSGWCNTDENRIEQCFAAHIVHSWQQYWRILLHPIQAQQYCAILLTSVNNVGSKTLFNPVKQRARRFLPCRGRLYEGTAVLLPSMVPHKITNFFAWRNIPAWLQEMNTRYTSSLPDKNKDWVQILPLHWNLPHWWVESRSKILR